MNWLTCMRRLCSRSWCLKSAGHCQLSVVRFRQPEACFLYWSNLLHMCLPKCTLTLAYIGAMRLESRFHQCYLALLY